MDAAQKPGTFAKRFPTTVVCKTCGARLTPADHRYHEIVHAKAGK